MLSPAEEGKFFFARGLGSSCAYRPQTSVPATTFLITLICEPELPSDLSMSVAAKDCNHRCGRSLRGGCFKETLVEEANSSGSPVFCCDAIKAQLKGGKSSSEEIEASRPAWWWHEKEVQVCLCVCVCSENLKQALLVNICAFVLCLLKRFPTLAWPRTG